ncbi:hypothetical protein B0H14DRAFT_367701 [Mycena olivaceomarginata]|nr:hypothetical protein B0H14DRAFT_367701 [Mycena olivaceomarginata]
MEPPIVLSLELPSSPDFTHLLRSNDIPLNSDIPFIRNIISNGQTRLDELNDQIESLQAKLAQLTQTRSEIAENVRQHRAALHPVRYVPPELICEIFLLVLLSADEDSANRATVPWCLSLVCRSWRQAALSYPPLWCSIILHSYPTRDPLTMTETQLLRSRNLPLDISWQTDKSVDFRLLESVVAHCGRWRTLRLNHCRTVFRGALDWLRPAVGRLARLEKLEMVFSSGTLSVPDVFGTAPALREVILTDAELGVPSPLINLPSSQITRYRGKHELRHQLEILEGASALVECAVSTTGRSPLQDMVRSPNLRRLHLDNFHILNYLEAPSLDTLYSRNSWSLRELSLFIQRCSCRLTKLTLIHCLGSFELVDLLRELPTLTYILLESRQRTLDALFNALTVTGASSDICPYLTSFLYGYHLPVEGTSPFGDSFSRMVQSRLEIHSAATQDPTIRVMPHRGLQFLRIFQLNERPLPPADLVALLGTLRDGGLDAAFLNLRDFEDLRTQDSSFI